MATYAIGDIQGCYAPLTRLLARIHFDPKRDRLWLVGDLVNRGPQSLEVLRWARDLGDRARCVLGNHDVHLIARWEGVSSAKRRDTLDEVLEAKDAGELVDWLAARPLVVRDGDAMMVHAGVPPEWTAAQAEQLGREACAALQRDRRRTLREIFAGRPRRWSAALSDSERLQYTFGALTRMRIVERDGGALRMDFNGALGDMPKGCVAWFDYPQRRSAGTTVICGHWAALGLHVGPGVVALDSGCVWGKALSAYRFEDQQIFQEPCPA